MSRIFINYRRQDSEGYVGRLYDHLVQHFGRDQLFMDVDDIKPGADFVSELEKAVTACDVVLSVIGPHWLNAADDSGLRRLDLWNDFVRIEIATALSQNKVVIPVLVGKARMPAPSDLPEDISMLSRRNAFELSHARFAGDVQKLVEIIQASMTPKGATKPDTTSEIVRQKSAAIKQIRDDLVNATTSPLYQHRIESRYFPVLGDGNPDANIVFIGESPGKAEAESGTPFIGPSGEVLDEMLGSINLKRADVYLTNMLLDRPPDNHDPLPEELAFYAPFVDRLIDVIQPKVIVTLGRFAMQHILKKLDLPEKRGKISQLHGKLIKAQMPYGEIHIVPLYHPAVVLYSATQRDILLKDFQKLKLFI